MKKEAFESNIIDSEKVESFNKLKRKTGIIHGVIGIVVFWLFNFSISNNIFSSLHTTWIVMGAILSIFLVGSAFIVVSIYIKTPTKGKLICHQDSISFVMGEETIDINIQDLSNLEFYFDHNICKVCFNYKSKLTCFKLDIIFHKEKEELKRVISDWKKNGFNIKVIINQSFKESFNQKKSKISTDSYESNRINFTKYNVYIQPRFPFYASTTIPYNLNSKKELYNLSMICIESLGWRITFSDSNEITVLTEPVFTYMGDVLSIKFYDKKLIVTSRNKRRGLFSLGSKLLINNFLGNLTILSNDFSTKNLEELSIKKACL
jgi:hypothetical protein